MALSLFWPLASTSCSLSRDFFSDSSPQTYFSGENFILIVFLIPFSSVFLSFFYSVFFYSIFFFLLFLVAPKRIFSENPSHFFSYKGETREYNCSLSLSLSL